MDSSYFPILFGFVIGTEAHTIPCDPRTLHLSLAMPGPPSNAGTSHITCDGIRTKWTENLAGGKMLGRHHALFGATAWLGIETVALHQGPGVIVLSSACCGAAAMLPDLDEPESSVAHAFQPFSSLCSRGLAKLCGGHRQASHSLAAALLAGALGTLIFLSPLVAAAVVAILVLIAVRGLIPFRLGYGWLAFVAAAGTGLAVARGDITVWWLPIVIAVGYLVHLLGDLVTRSGVPLLFPDHRRIAWPVLNVTGSGRERLFAAVLWVVLLLCLFVDYGSMIRSGGTHILHLI